MRSMEHARQRLDQEGLLIYGVTMVTLCAMQQRLVMNGRRDVWNEVLAALNAMAATAEKIEPIGP